MSETLSNGYVSLSRFTLFEVTCRRCGHFSGDRGYWDGRRPASRAGEWSPRDQTWRH